MTQEDKLLERIQKLMALADPTKNDNQAQIEVLAYELAAALIEEVHYSQTPSEHTLQLLEKAL